jgi:hypothetical protein
MARVSSIVFIALVLVLGTCAGVLLLAHAQPSTEALDSDLAEIRAQIKAADEEDSKYQGGLIKALVLIRREILRTTEAMLEQKRASFLRRIALNYIVNGKPIVPATDERLRGIAADLDRANASVSKHLAEAEHYSGGLIQGMSLMAVATDRLTLAQLNLAYYQAKYGMAPVVEIPRSGLSVPRDLGTIVKDKDAF